MQPFATRQQAGEELARKLGEYRGGSSARSHSAGSGQAESPLSLPEEPPRAEPRGGRALVLGIPRGGVAVGFSVARALGLSLEVVVPRKVPIPWEPEAGFGAVCADGTLILNEPLVQRIGLTPAEIAREAEKVRLEVVRRTLVYRGERPFPDLTDKTAIVVDDGLATGYTMIAALLSLKKAGAKELVAAVPVSPRDSLEAVRPYADRVVCLEVSDRYPFAVAMYYGEFPEMSDEEVREMLACAGEQ